MEKYRKFADAKYGINPFVPVKAKNPPSKLIKYTFGIFLLLVRLPIVLSLIVTLYFYHMIFGKFIVVKSLRESIEKILSRFLAISFGIYDYSVIPKFRANDPNRPRLSPGHVVLCNHTHPLDFLFFSQRCSPLFVGLTTKGALPGGEKEVVLTPLNFIQTLKYFLSTSFDLSSAGSQASRVGELANTTFKKSEGPIVIFFEGATTNGKGVLEIQEGLAYDLYEFQKQENRETVVASISYGDNANASVAHPITATLSLLMNFQNHVTVRLCPVAKMPIQRKDMPKTIYDIYESIHELPKLALRSEDYKEFLQYWKATQKKTYSSLEKNQ